MVREFEVVDSLTVGLAPHEFETVQRPPRITFLGGHVEEDGFSGVTAGRTLTFAQTGCQFEWQPIVAALTFEGPGLERRGFVGTGRKLWIRTR